MPTDFEAVRRTLWSAGNHNLVMRRLISFVVILCYTSRGFATATASHCYPDYCRSVANLAPVPGFQCVLTKVEKGGDCSQLALDGIGHAPVTTEAGKFNLRAYVYEESGTKATAFNFSISDASFHGLVTRYQSLVNKTWSACRYIELYGNETQPVPSDLYVACPFSDDSYESTPYRLDYLVAGKTFNYSKRYVFNVPVHKFIEHGTSIKDYRPFVYIDVTNAPVLSLHIQPLPETYNVTKYRIWLVNNNTNSVTFTDMFSTTSKQDIRYNFTAHTGVFYFKVSPVHADCGDLGCANSTTPFIIIQKASHRLLIMIISTVWIPPVLLYVLYHVYKLYRKASTRRKGAPRCLLVYLPSRSSHVNTMIELTKYLRACNVIAMIDVLDAADRTGEDLERWCDTAFQSADVVVLAASPPAKKSATTMVYRNTYDYLLRLIESNRSQRGKRYCVVQLPYCKPEDAPAEAWRFSTLYLPKELSKLVKVVHQADCARCVASVSDKEFLDSVKIAKLETLEVDARDAETENLLSKSSAASEKRTFLLAPADDSVVPRSFATNIDELNLLGKSESEEESRSRPSSMTGVPLFRVDQLNL